MSQTGKDWSFVGVWNKSLERVDQRPVVPRDYLWASELGKAPVDVFLRLKGTIPSNPPDSRSMRKFEAGNVFEWVVSLILKRAGILIDDQRHTKFQYQGLLEVTGRCDFIAGGKPDFDKAVAELKALDMPEVFVKAAEAMRDYFAQHYPNGLREKPLEIKSVSVHMFESLLRGKKPMSHHRKQCFHYVISGGYDLGSIIYICRDDLRIMEFPVYRNDVNEQEYKKAIEVISEYYIKDIQPPLEEPIVFDEDMGKFTSNFNVGYSGYLTLLYGLKNQGEFDAKYKKTPARWNRVMNRFKEGKKMTKANLEAMAEITISGFDVARIAKQFVESAEAEDEEEAGT